MWLMKGIALLFMISGIAGRCMAQSNFYEEDPKIFEGGLILGANFAQIDGDNYYGYYKLGLNTGGFVYIHFTEKIGATFELSYSQQGSRGGTVDESQGVRIFTGKYYMNLNYVTVPLTVHYKTHGIDVEAGALYARLIKSREWVLTDYPVAIDPVKNKFNNTDIEYVFGIGCKVYKKLHANVRFQYSITSIRSEDRIPVSLGYGNQGQWNNLVNLRLYYIF